MCKPYIISIAGESGVGKSTISGIISLFFGENNVLSISTDDLHKWDRSNPVWNNITHLNPDANNLELGDIQLSTLLENKAIYRSIYNHHTGGFDPPKKLEPKRIVINEGLHAFYSETSQLISDMKIFVDTDEDLRTHWKLIRDTEERGYRYNDVLETISKRKLDSDKIRDRQLALADVIIKINARSKINRLGDKHELVKISISVQSLKFDVNNDLLYFIQKYMTDFSDFIKASEIIGHDIEMCQNGGGNISVKTDNFMTIKASGFNMKDVHRLSGYSVLNYKNVTASEISNDSELDNVLISSTGDKYKRPSMETGMHAVLQKYVLHAHPIYITLLLCLRDSKQIVKQIFSDLEHDYIEYTNPGYGLFNAFKQTDQTKTVFFLENHGVVVSSNNVDLAIELLFDINQKAKKHIEQMGHFEPFNVLFANHQKEPLHPFPDSIMFLNDPSKAETIAAHNYINIIGSKIGEIRHISDENKGVLSNLESEKYRKKA